MLCDLLAQKGDLDGAIAACRRASELAPGEGYDGALAALTDQRDRAKAAGATGWRLLDFLCAEAVGRDSYPRARVLAEDALAAAPAAGTWDDATRAEVRQLRYNLGCFFATACAKRGEAHAPRFEIGDEARARNREAAFDHLAKAVALGWKDPTRAEEDPDLAPLRDDPRWKAFRDSVKR